MDSFEINKIVAAVLMVALLVIGIGKLSDVIFHVEKPETPGYKVEVEQIVKQTTAKKDYKNASKALMKNIPDEVKKHFQNVDAIGHSKRKIKGCD